MDSIDAELNNVAYRCFRDIADGDYIAARMAFRSHLWVQFLWCAQQALEKYLKCILLLNRIPSRQVRHDIGAALELINEKADFAIQLDSDQDQIFRRIDAYGNNRYLEGCYHVKHHDLLLFDKLVWYLRQFCCSLGYSLGSAEKSPELFEIMLRSIEKNRNNPAILNGMITGKLGKILKERKHPARPFLVWNNAYFAVRPDRTIKVFRGFSAENAPLCLRPQMVHELRKYIFLTKEAITAYSE